MAIYGGQNDQYIYQYIPQNGKIVADANNLKLAKICRLIS